MRRLLAVLCCLVAPATADAAAPAVQPGPPTSVGRNAVTVTGTVQTGGLATTVRVEYGTTGTGEYTTGERAVGEADEAVPVEVTLTGLRAGTAYRYRLVATNADGPAATGEQKVVTVAASAMAPRAPAAATKAIRDVQPTAAVFTATVNPRGLPTRYAFEYGVTPALGTRTAEASLGAPARRSTVARTVTGLQPGTRYYARVVAANPAGAIAGVTRSFVTPRGLESVLLRPVTRVLTWGGATTVRGRVVGGNVRGLTVVLERQDYPFRSAFRADKRRTTDKNGVFFFPLDRLRTSVRVRVKTQTAAPATSAALQIGTRIQVSVAVRRAARRKVTLAGTVRPGVGRGRVVLQRRAGRRWITVGRARVRRQTATRSRFRVTLSRRSRATAFRLVAVPSATRRYARGTSRLVRVGARRGR